MFFTSPVLENEWNSHGSLDLIWVKCTHKHKEIDKDKEMNQEVWRWTEKKIVAKKKIRVTVLYFRNREYLEHGGETHWRPAIQPWPNWIFLLFLLAGWLVVVQFPKKSKTDLFHSNRWDSQKREREREREWMSESKSFIIRQLDKKIK